LLCDFYPLYKNCAKIILQKAYKLFLFDLIFPYFYNYRVIYTLSKNTSVCWRDDVFYQEVLNLLLVMRRISGITKLQLLTLCLDTLLEHSTKLSTFT